MPYEDLVWSDRGSPPVQDAIFPGDGDLDRVVAQVVFWVAGPKDRLGLPNEVRGRAGGHVSAERNARDRTRSGEEVAGTKDGYADAGRS